MRLMTVSLFSNDSENFFIFFIFIHARINHLRVRGAELRTLLSCARGAGLNAVAEADDFFKLALSSFFN